MKTTSPGSAEVVLGARERRKAIFAGVIGLGLQSYDVGIYGFLTTVIALNFFPQSNPTTALLLAWLGFSATYVATPLGSVVVGHLADKLGRRLVMILGMVIVSACTVGIGALPTYAQIGLLAPTILFILRFVQGFVGSGETGGAMAYVVETADQGRRGFYASFGQAAIGLGGVVAVGVSAIMANLVPEEAFNTWAWRVPFLVAALTGLYAIYIRINVDESPKFRQIKVEHRTVEIPILALLRNEWRGVLIVAALLGYWYGIAIIMIGYGPTYAATEGGLPLSQVLLAATIGNAILPVMAPVFGALSDRMGRKPLLVASSVAAVFLAFPLFWLMSIGSFWGFVLALAVIAFLYAMMAGAVAMVSEVFSTATRSTGYGIGVNLGLFLYAAHLPFTSTWLISATGNSLAPAALLLAFALLSAVAMIFFYKETRDTDLSY
jgi:MHS family proline/betaine transporter-like MFS transporter